MSLKYNLRDFGIRGGTMKLKELNAVVLQV